METASATYTLTKVADAVRVGGYLVINNFPCKVIGRSQAGWRHTLRIQFKGIDIFSGERHEMIVRGKDIVDIPIVSTKGAIVVEYPNRDSLMTVVDDAGTYYRVPAPDGWEEKNAHSTVTMLCAMGRILVRIPNAIN